MCCSASVSYSVQRKPPTACCSSFGFFHEKQKKQKTRQNMNTQKLNRKTVSSRRSGVVKLKFEWARPLPRQSTAQSTVQLEGGEGSIAWCDRITLRMFGQDTLAFSSLEPACKVKYLPRNQALSMSRICRLGNCKAEWKKGYCLL